MNSARGRSTRRIVDAPERARPGTTCDKQDDVAIYTQMQICRSLMNERLRRVLGPHVITNRGYFVMVALRSRPGNRVNSSELCDATGESRGNMTRICDDLVDKRLMRRRPNLEDRRYVELSLTASGMALLGVVAPTLRGRADLQRFTETEKVALQRLLSRFAEALGHS